MAITVATNPALFLEGRIQNPIEGRDVGAIGLSRIAGTHGTTVDSIFRLARDGRFSGGIHDDALDGTFHLTPNLRFSGWNKTSFSHDVGSLVARGYNQHPM